MFIYCLYLYLYNKKYFERSMYVYRLHIEVYKIKIKQLIELKKKNKICIYQKI